MNRLRFMKNIPEQIKMLKELRDSKSISENEFQDMLDILLNQLDEQNEEIEESPFVKENSGATEIDQKNNDFEPIMNSEAESKLIFQDAKKMIFASQIYTTLYGLFLIGTFLFWHELMRKEGFWEQFIIFSFLTFLLGTIYESKLTAWLYKNFSAVLNLTIFSKRKINENLNVDDAVYLFISDSRNADGQRVLNKLIQYFILYRFGLVLLYKIAVNTFLDRIIPLEKALFFEQLSTSGMLFYYELLLLIGIKLYLVSKAFNSGLSLKNELAVSFSKPEIHKVSALNPQLQFFITNEKPSYFGPFSRNQVKQFIGLKLTFDEKAIKNGYGTTVEKVQFVQ